MKKTAALLIGLIMVGAVMLSDAQTTAPTNLAGAEFPCNYHQPGPNVTTAKFLETVNDVTFLTGNVEVRRSNIIVRADSAICQPNGECELNGKVTMTLSATTK